MNPPTRFLQVTTNNGKEMIQVLRIERIQALADGGSKLWLVGALEHFWVKEDYDQIANVLHPIVIDEHVELPIGSILA